MEKTIEYMRTAVLAECEAVCPSRLYAPIECGHLAFGYVEDDGVQMEAWFLYVGAATAPMSLYALAGEQVWLAAYRLLGLDKRDALEAERVFWTASTDSLTKSLEAEKVKNANGGEFKDMLQQVLNHSNRPEMDDAQFRMFARENINHLLYGNKEGKKDGN